MASDNTASEPLLASPNTISEQPAKPELNPKTTHVEFSGVPGALGISIGLPILIYVLYYAIEGPTNFEDFSKVFDVEALAAYLLWFFGLVGLFYIVPGRVMEGTVLRDGTTLWYKMNGEFIYIYLDIMPSSRNGTTNRIQQDSTAS